MNQGSEANKEAEGEEIARRSKKPTRIRRKNRMFGDPPDVDNNSRKRGRRSSTVGQPR